MNNVNSAGHATGNTTTDSRPIVVVFTADQTAAHVIGDAFAATIGVDQSAVHVVALDPRVFAPVAGDKSTFEGWKDSRPDQLRTLIRASVSFIQELVFSTLTFLF